MVNSMPYFRARKQKSGNVHYYFDTGSRPRKEIPLGSDYREAVKKWIELSAMPVATASETFADLADRYEAEVMPLKAPTTQATQRGDMKKLREFFCQPSPAPLNSIKPKHIYQMLQWAKGTPTTANRLKRLFSHMFNTARAWGWTECENPCAGIEGHSLGKREVYISDAVYSAVYEHSDEPLQHAMDLAYLTGQRPGDVLSLTHADIVDGLLIIKQSKTSAPLRFEIEGQLQALLAKIAERKSSFKSEVASLLLNQRGQAMSKHMLKNAFTSAREAAALTATKTGDADLAAQIRAFWFYDLRAKAADDVADDRGELAASRQLGHTSVQTTKRHYLRRGARVKATK
ncbi:tyrosine-type recombinase/integrase [Comamonas sp.]|uniref:tyrosine-type recombinase/integrase n=1 Tax=Comamonas sp. TaxID=34028 RepID=UPI003A93526F